MLIECQSCGRSSEFILPLWVRTTFKFNGDGSFLEILHVKHLESLEEKLTDQSRDLTCKECGSNEIGITFNEYEASGNDDNEKAALAGL